jgi:hypothetical protein
LSYNEVADANILVGNDNVDYGKGVNTFKNIERLRVEIAGKSANNYVNGSASTRGISFAGGDGNDVIVGGSGNDSFHGGNGINNLKGGAGDDKYTLREQFAIITTVTDVVGTTIDDSSGTNDFLQLGKTVNSATALSKSGTTLQIDLNNDQKFEASKDLAILNFFDESGGSGNGYIETIQNGYDTGGFIGQPRVFAEVIKPFAILRTSPIKNDFGKDKISDILWRNNNGKVNLWQMDGTSIIYNNPVISFVDASWKIVSTNDFNGDGSADILWQNTNGQISLWQMNGPNTTTAGLISQQLDPLDAAWRVVATGDFNKDRKADILRRTDNGDVAIWEMNGQETINSKVLGNVDKRWNTAGTGDFNNDGKADILWRKNNGDVAIWQMDGTNVVKSDVLGNVSVDWKVAGVNDFNDDGNADIVWQNDDGRIALWHMNGNNVVFADVIGNALGFTIAGTGDYNGDGKGDLLLRNSQGANAIWNTNGKNITSQNAIASIDASWTVAPPNGLTPPPLLNS